MSTLFFFGGEGGPVCLISILLTLLGGSSKKHPVEMQQQKLVSPREISKNLITFLCSTHLRSEPLNMKKINIIATYLATISNFFFYQVMNLCHMVTYCQYHKKWLKVICLIPLVSG